VLSTLRVEHHIRYGLRAAEQRFVITPETVARRVERRCSRSGPSSNALRQLKMSPEYTIMGRVELGVEAVIAQLRPGNEWGAIAAEHLENAAPVTMLGKRQRAFYEARRARSV